MNNGVNTNNNVNNNIQTGVTPTYNQVPQQPVIQQTTTVQPQTVQQQAVQQQVPAVQQQPQVVATQPITQQTVQAPEQPTIVQTAEEENINKTDEQQTQQETPKQQEMIGEKPKKEKKKISFTPILLLIILILGGYTIYSSKTHKSEIDNLNYNCTAVTASKEEVKLDLNSTLVKDLYSKVETTIREDIAQPEFNNNMRIYLAYRQILEKDKYDSNCNLFDSQKMEPYKCEISLNFVPKAFKVETLVEEYKKLFGEKSTIQLENAQLGSSCIGGYEYIEQRGEYVQGYCEKDNATSYKATKKLVEATSSRNIVILKEEVKYHENEGMSLPAFLKSGYYYYTFRLDLNYNYVLVSKEYQSKY